MVDTKVPLSSICLHNQSYVNVHIRREAIEVAFLGGLSVPEGQVPLYYRPGQKNADGTEPHRHKRILTSFPALTFKGLMKNGPS